MDLNLLLGFHLLVILTKFVTGFITSTRKVKNYLLSVRIGIHKFKIHATLSNRKLGITIIVDDLSFSELPCTLQLEKAMNAQYNTLLGLELISTSKITMEYV